MVEDKEREQSRFVVYHYTLLYHKQKMMFDCNRNKVDDEGCALDLRGKPWNYLSNCERSEMRQPMS